MSVSERVHSRRMREEEGRTNVCGREGACKKDEGEEGRTMSAAERVHVRRMKGGGGEDKCLQWRWCM